MDRIKKLSLQRKERNRWNLKKVNKSDRPRLSVHRSNTHISAQIIDDLKGITI
jgi:large subunit ribosomal protein L18